MRFVAISDTHGLQPELPPGDVLIHAGDLSSLGLESEFIQGIKWLSDQPHKYKILVPGNHDRFACDFWPAAFARCQNHGISLLVDEWWYWTESREINARIFGSPRTPRYGRTCAFMYTKAEARGFWEPKKHLQADILITHGPPERVFDDGSGCPSLLDAVGYIKPKVHIFGHIHAGHGGRLLNEWNDGTKTLFANVAYMNEHNKPSGDPILVFDENGHICE